MFVRWLYPILGVALIAVAALQPVVGQTTTTGGSDGSINRNPGTSDRTKLVDPRLPGLMKPPMIQPDYLRCCKDGLYDTTCTPEICKNANDRLPNGLLSGDELRETGPVGSKLKADEGTAAAPGQIRECRHWRRAEFIDERYRAHAAMDSKSGRRQACNPATVEVFRLRRDWWQLEQRSDSNARAVDAYARYCFSPEATRFLPELTDGEMADVTERLVFVRKTISRLGECHGVRLGPYVVTALHCARHQASGLPAEMIGRTVSGTTFPLEEVWPGRSARYDDPTQDIVVFRMLGQQSALSRSDVQDAVAGALTEGRIFMPQSNYFVRRASGYVEGRDARATLRLNDSPLCRVADVTAAGLYLHSCATEYGTSGAPMFQRGRDGRVRLAGIHLGGLDSTVKSAPASWHECRAQAGNYGLAIPPFIIELLTR